MRGRVWGWSRRCYISLPVSTTYTLHLACSHGSANLHSQNFSFAATPSKFGVQKLLLPAVSDPVGWLWTGLEAPVPCTPYGCLLMLKETLRELKGKRALVLGRSNIVGKPMAALLLAEHCTLTIAHSRTQDLAERCREADILVAAVDRPEMVRGDWIKPGAAVIDAVGRRRGVRRGQDGRRLHHPGAGRRWADDNRQPATQHRHRGVPPERPPRSGAFIESY